MYVIRELEAGDVARTDELARLHKRAFPVFFLTQLGIPFLKTLYKGYLEDKESGIIIAESKGRILGFIAYSNNYSEFYRGLIKHSIMQFAMCAFFASLRHPSFIKRLLGAFKKSDSVARKEKYVELASICVNPGIKGHGLGTKLIDALKSRVDFSYYEYINLETDAENNEYAIRFYEKNGFERAREYTTNEGRRMIEYRYRGQAR